MCMCHVLVNKRKEGSEETPGVITTFTVDFFFSFSFRFVGLLFGWFMFSSCHCKIYGKPRFSKNDLNMNQFHIGVIQMSIKCSGASEKV